MPETIGAKRCMIREQIIEDSCGLTFQFERKKGFHGGELTDESVLRVFGGAIPFGNREIAFGPDGREAGAGTSTRGLCRPAWVTEIDD